jgi:hypothetical protein
VTLSDLDAELRDRGFDYLSESRRHYLINRAYFEMCEEQDWPFLEATTSSTAPITITDLRTIESVVDTTQEQSSTPHPRETSWSRSRPT